MWIGLNVNCLLFLSDFNYCLIFLTDLRKLIQANFIKTHPVAAELFHADTQTDGRRDKHDDVNSPFSQLFITF